MADAPDPMHLRQAHAMELLTETERAAQIGTYAWRVTDGQIHWSEEMFRIFGVAPTYAGNLIEAFWAAVHPADRDRVRASEAQMLKTGIVPATEFRVVRPDGTERFVRGQGSVVHASGAPVEFVGTIHDLTDQRAAEREGARTDEMHRALESLAGVGSYRWVPRTGEVVWSAQFRAIIGVAPDAPASFEGFLARLPPDDQQRLQASTARALATGVTESLPVRLRRDDGTLRHLVLEGRFVESGELLGAVLDVTRLRQLETDLLQSQKLEALGRLASGIAHDFNNVLAVLRLGLEARTAGPRVVSELFTAIDRGASLTRQLLAFSRRNLLEPRPTEVRDLVQESVALVERLLGDAVRVKQTPPGLDPLVVHVDPTQLQQALINLFVNARDAMPGGGTVWVSCRVRDVRASPEGFAPPLQPGAYVEIEVRDEGTGIAPDVLPHIFEPFYTTKAEGHGTGLGLASVHGFVTQSGGGVSVASSTGAGSTFRILLPRVGRAADGAGADAERPALLKGKGERILVIDDLPAIRNTLAAVLSRAGFVPVCVEDLPALAADPARHAASCEAVVTDLDMPGYRGEEVARMLRRHAPGLPVLFMSGHAVPEPAEDGTAFLAKPFSADQAIDTLAALLSRG